MINRLTLLIGAVVVAVLLVFGIQQCRNIRADHSSRAVQHLVDAESAAAPAQDSVRAKRPVAEHADSTLTGILRRPPLPAPRIVYRDRPASNAVVPNDGIAPPSDTVAYVQKSEYDSLAARYRTLQAAAMEYRTATRELLDAQRTLIAKQENVIASAKQVIAHPAPSRRWGIGAHAGYGGTLYRGLIVQGPQVGVSVQVRLF